MRHNHNVYISNVTVKITDTHDNQISKILFFFANYEQTSQIVLIVIC